MNEVVAECSSVYRRFRQGDIIIEAVVDGNLTLNRGDFICLTGPSGSGKSTLLHMLGTLDEPDEGNVRIRDVAVEKLSESAKAKLRLSSIGFVFQSHNLIPVLSALENVSFILELQGVRAKERDERSKAMLAAVGLEDLLHRRPHEMSGGQQQRVAIARAVVSNPAIVLADEPTASLDSTTSRQVMALLRELNQTRHVTIVYATHDNTAMEFADRHINMIDGRINELPVK